MPFLENIRRDHVEDISSTCESRASSFDQESYYPIPRHLGISAGVVIGADMILHLTMIGVVDEETRESILMHRPLYNDSINPYRMIRVP